MSLLTPNRSDGSPEGQQGEAAAALPAPPPAPAAAGLRPAAARRLLQVTASLAVMIASTYVVPALHGARPWKRGDGYIPFWNVIGREWLGQGREMARQQEEFERWKQAQLAAATAVPNVEERAPDTHPASPGEPTRFPEYAPPPEDAEPLQAPLEYGAALDHYYRRLALADMGVEGVVVRACHWGDSLLGDDVLPMAIRTRLQARFGDAGHGFHYLAPFSNFNKRLGIRFLHMAPWSLCEVSRKCEPDARYGLAGVSARSTGGAQSRFSTALEGPGKNMSRFELWYEEGPGLGVFEVDIDGKKSTVSSEAPRSGDDVAVFEMVDGPHEVTVRAVPGAPVRGYGVVLEREGPGVVWDNVSLIGAYAMSLHNHDPEHIAGQIRRRRPDLLVFSLSGNDAQRAAADIREHFEAEYLRTLRTFRAGRPEASCLVLSVTAHGKRAANAEIVDRRAVAEMVAIQRKLAKDEGCGFIDLYQAMGGSGAVAKWFYSRPRLMDVDLGHPTGVGRELLASFVYRALMRGYSDYRARVAGTPVGGEDAGPGDLGVEAEPAERVDGVPPESVRGG